MLCVGMPLNEILRSVTSTPAFAIGWQDRIGSLKVGREADVTVLSLESCHLYIEDCQAQQRLLKQVSCLRSLEVNDIYQLMLAEVCSESCLASGTTRFSDGT